MSSSDNEDDGMAAATTEESSNEEMELDQDQNQQDFQDQSQNQDQDDHVSIAGSETGSVFSIPYPKMSNKEYFLKMIEHSQNWELKNQEEAKKLLGKISRSWKKSEKRLTNPKNTYELSLALTHIRDVGKMLLHQTTLGTVQNFDVNLYTDALVKLGIDEEAEGEEYNCDLAAENFSLQAWRIRRKINKLNIMPTFTSAQIEELKAKKDKALELKANKPKAIRVKKVFDESKVKNYNEMTKISKAEREDLEEKSTTSVCQKVYKILRSHLKEHNIEEIPLVEFALEKTFEETLNNLFYLFFLTKDGLIGARSEVEDEDPNIEHLIIKPTNQKNAKSATERERDSERFSMVMAFDMKTWKRLTDNHQSKYGDNEGIVGKLLHK